jgi:hypothetical protein
MKHNRIELINHYEKIVNDWNKPDSDLKRLFPDDYKRIYSKLEGLKNGANFTITDVTKECVCAAGILVGCGVPLSNGTLLGSTKKYQNGIKNFKVKDLFKNK